MVTMIQPRAEDGNQDEKPRLESSARKRIFQTDLENSQKGGVLMLREKKTRGNIVAQRGRRKEEKEFSERFLKKKWDRSPTRGTMKRRKGRGSIFILSRG